MNHPAPAGQEPITYPIRLDQAAIARLIPHRPPMLFVQQATVLAHDTYEGTALWPGSHPLLAGHFPGCAIVPGVMVLEAAAQLAGIGLLAGDPVARGIGPGHLGMLTAVRKCFFRRPLLPDCPAHLQLHCRRMADKAVLVTGNANADGHVFATLEFMVAHVPADSLQGMLAPDMLQRLLQLPGGGA